MADGRRWLFLWYSCFDTSFETRIRGGGGKNNIEEKAELGKNGVEK